MNICVEGSVLKSNYLRTKSHGKKYETAIKYRDMRCYRNNKLILKCIRSLLIGRHDNPLEFSHGFPDLSTPKSTTHRKRQTQNHKMRDPYCQPSRVY